MSTARYLKSSRMGLLQPVLWVIYFIINFRLFARIPAGNIEEIFFLLVLFIILVYCIHDFATQMYSGKFSKMLPLLLPLLLLPFINAYQATKVFHQPYFYGVLAQRQSYLILGAWFIVIALKREFISWSKLERYFLLSMYIILVTMYFFYVFIDPNIFADSEFVKFTLNKGWIYKFPNGVTAGLLIYSFIKILLRDKFIYIIPFIACLWYFIYYSQDRSQLFFLAITLLAIYTNTAALRRKAFYALIAITGLSISLVLLLILNPDLLGKYVELYMNASDIFTKSSSVESSTNIRFIEGAIAANGIDAHPWLGNGLLSNRWYDGYFQFFKYFYPADVGILGNLYVFGIIGTLLFYIPYVSVLVWAIKMRKIKDPLLLTCIYGMLFLFFDMLTAASNLTFMGLPAFFFGVVYYYRYYVFPNHLEGLIH